MADTHVNAFYADVEEKKQAVVAAQGELEAAQLRLKNKLIEIGDLTAQEEPKQENSETETPDPAPGKGSVFKKK